MTSDRDEGSIEVVRGSVETTTDVRLRELVDVFREQHEKALEAGRMMVEHAIAAGEALLEAKTLIPSGEWGVWLDRTMPNGRRNSACRNYMRLAALKEHVDPELPLTTNLQLITGLQRASSGTPRHPPEAKAEAIRLHATGEFTNVEIARMVNTTKETIRCWTDPEYAEHKWKQSRARQAERRRAKHPELVAAQDHGDRSVRYGEPGRAAVGRAVRRLAQVQGARETREALLDLVAICNTWANRLGASGASIADVHKVDAVLKEVA